MNKKNSQFLLIAAGALLLAIIGYLLFQNSQLRQKLTPSTPPDVVLLDKTSTEPTKTANWKTYTNSKYGYSIKFSSNLEAEDSGNYSTLFNVIQTKPSGPSLPTFYISVIPDGFWQNGAIYNYPKADFLTILFSISVGQLKAIYPGDLARWNTWTRLSDTIIDENNASVFENSQVWEYRGKEKRVFVKKTGFTYMIGSYYQTDDESKNFNQILQTFRFSR